MRQPPTHPGEMLLEEFLKPLDLSQAEAASRMQMTANRLNEIVKGRRGVMHWDLWHAASARRSA